jgi:hypothetical protein
MHNADVVALVWGSARCIDGALEALARGDYVEMVLPADTHHALFAHLYPAADRGAPENLDIRGAPQMVSRMATVAGLGGLERLEAPLARAGYRVGLSTPPPVLRLLPPSAA